MESLITWGRSAGECGRGLECGAVIRAEQGRRAGDASRCWTGELAGEAARGGALTTDGHAKSPEI
jgi:hypothetical protein